MFALLLGAALAGPAWAQYAGGGFGVEESPAAAESGATPGRLFPRLGRLRSAHRPLLRRGDLLERGEQTVEVAGEAPASETATEDSPRLGARFWARSLTAMRRLRQAAQERDAESTDRGPSLAGPSIESPSAPQRAYVGPPRRVLESVKDNAEGGGVVIEMGSEAEPIGLGVAPALVPPTSAGEALDEVPNFEVQINVPDQSEPRRKPGSILRPWSRP
ncbi:MAG: hypothetical protein RIC55_31795 [Pirellulaceae bacterium]